MPVPYTFGSATSSIPLSQLDSNFATAITIGNTAVQLGNTVTTLNNMTLANVTISSGNVTLTNVTVTTANATTANIGTSIVTTSETLSYGTANGVVYLNGSKVATTGTALVFDGTNLGIGTSSPSAKLDVAINTTTSARFGTTASDAGVGISLLGASTAKTWNISSNNFTAGALQFARSTAAGGTTYTTPDVTFDSSGNVGIGTTSPSAKLEVYGASYGKTKINGGTGGELLLSSAGTDVGDIYANSTLVNFSSVTAVPLIFGTNNTERARIDSSGNLLVGTTSLGYRATKLTLSADSGTTTWAVGPSGANSTNFYVIPDGTHGVYLSGTSATSWSSASDERVKTDLEPIENATNKVCSLRAMTGRYISDETNTRKSFLIAQDVLAVLPEAVDTTDPEKYGLAYTDVIPLLVAAIKEQQALIQTLTDRLTALEAK